MNDKAANTNVVHLLVAATDARPALQAARGKRLGDSVTLWPNTLSAGSEAF
jgi:hypothetical protein